MILKANTSCHLDSSVLTPKFTFCNVLGKKVPDLYPKTFIFKSGHFPFIIVCIYFLDCVAQCLSPALSFETNTHIRPGRGIT